MVKNCSTCKYYRLPINVKCTECWHPWEKWEPNWEPDKKLEEKEEQKPDFIKKYQIDVPRLTLSEDITNGVSGSVHAIVEKICVFSLEKHETIIHDEIIKIAKEAGIGTMYVLNKDAIVEALSKQIPLPLNDGCPKCHYNMREEDYCPHCGQKLEWWKPE